MGEGGQRVPADPHPVPPGPTTEAPGPIYPLRDPAGPARKRPRRTPCQLSQARARQLDRLLSQLLTSASFSPPASFFPPATAAGLQGHSQERPLAPSRTLGATLTSPLQAAFLPVIEQASSAPHGNQSPPLVMRGDTSGCTQAAAAGPQQDTPRRIGGDFQGHLQGLFDGGWTTSTQPRLASPERRSDQVDDGSTEAGPSMGSTRPLGCTSEARSQVQAEPGPGSQERGLIEMEKEAGDASLRKAVGEVGSQESQGMVPQGGPASPAGILGPGKERLTGQMRELHQWVKAVLKKPGPSQSSDSFSGVPPPGCALENPGACSDNGLALAPSVSCLGAEEAVTSTVSRWDNAQMAAVALEVLSLLSRPRGGPGTQSSALGGPAGAPGLQTTPPSSSGPSHGHAESDVTFSVDTGSRLQLYGTSVLRKVTSSPTAAQGPPPMSDGTSSTVAVAPGCLDGAVAAPNWTVTGKTCQTAWGLQLPDLAAGLQQAFHRAREGTEGTDCILPSRGHHVGALHSAVAAHGQPPLQGKRPSTNGMAAEVCDACHCPLARAAGAGGVFSSCYDPRAMCVPRPGGGRTHGS
jgi:hypothetical protein